MRTEGVFSKRTIGGVFVLFAALLLCASCMTPNSGRVTEYPPPEMPAEPIEYPEAPEIVKTVDVEVGDSQSSGAYPGPGGGAQVVFTGVAAGDPADQMIVKNADLRLLVDDTPIAIDRVTQVVEDFDGYIVSSRLWYQQQRESKYQFATLTIRVPVDDFEPALRRLRDISILVLDESTSGQDVTGEYVDLNSQLENLGATRDRIRTFLERAEDAEQALKVNQQLTQVEAQIAQIQGRMKHLYDRAAFSTITLNLEPELPLPQADPTPIATAWSPGGTAAEATDALIDITRKLVDLGIWLLIVVLPLVILPLLVFLLVILIVRRRRARRVPEDVGAAENSE